MLKRLIVISLAALTSAPVFAASSGAGAEFAAKVEQSCVSATSGMLTDAKAVVDPFGSESYGVAIVTGSVSDGKQAAIICVFDKQSEAVQAVAS